jgi:long-subunit acyl-CoA synthetase (AMP-forming)
VSKSKYILTHPLALQVAKEAASQVGIPESKIFVIIKDDSKLANIPDLMKLGEKAPEITPLKLAPGESKKRVALLNFSSGTSGLPKGVLITHYNVIANVCQLWSPESSDGNPEGKVSSGCLPFYHSMTSIVDPNNSLRSHCIDACPTS